MLASGNDRFPQPLATKTIIGRQHKRVVAIRCKVFYSCNQATSTTKTSMVGTHKQHITWGHTHDVGDKQYDQCAWIW